MRRRAGVNPTVGVVWRLGAMLMIVAIFAGLGKRLVTGRMPAASTSGLLGGATVSPAMEGIEWKTVAAPAWMTGIYGNDQSKSFILLRARDCLTCLDLGRRLREYARGASVASIHIVTTRDDSARVDSFLRREKVESARLTVLANSQILLPDAMGQPPAMVSGRAHREFVDVIELRWTIADTVSFAGLLDRRQAARSQGGTRK